MWLPLTKELEQISKSLRALLSQVTEKRRSAIFNSDRKLGCEKQQQGDNRSPTERRLARKHELKNQTKRTGSRELEEKKSFLTIKKGKMKKEYADTRTQIVYKYVCVRAQNDLEMMINTH